MNLVAGAMGNLATKLLQLLQDEYKLHKSLRSQVDSLAKELESTHVALCMVAQVPHDQLDPQVRLWARDVREASYDMEDVLDTFLVRLYGGGGRQDQDADKGKVVERLGEMMSNLFGLSKFKVRRDIASAIKDIKKKLREVDKRRGRCKVDKVLAKLEATSTIDPRLASCSTIDPRLEAMYRDVTQLVGIERTMGELISMLSVQKHEVSKDKLNIVSVFGTGGLGKTTLAKAVYDKLKPQFDCGAFVPVGRNPCLKKVFRDILIDLDKHRYNDMVNLSILDERQLINQLQDFLGRKRYIIVIDDLWETQSWETIKLALVENNRDSKIISTTRKLLDEVTGGRVYRLQPLSDDNSKRLFYTRIFGREGNYPDNQVNEVSVEILKKCGGIPLAIITMASLLVHKSRGEWFELCNSFGFRNTDNVQVDRTNWILSLSYYDLPCQLRTCLLYLSAFPEDYIIDKSSLIWKWIAEDFVQKKSGIGLFEVGEGYFNDLVNRSMIQAVVSKYNGIIYGCRVHDMMLDLLRSLSSEENHVTILNNNEGTLSIRCARRLAQHQRSKIDAHLDNHNGMHKVRSFTAYRCYVEKELWFFSLELLRVLDLENVYSKSWHNAKNLGRLPHLRFLGLKHTNMHELPKEIGALKFLQTLDLVQNFFMEELPPSIGQLTRLVCLRAWGTRVPNGVIEKLVSLQELLIECDERDKYEGQLKELGKLSELRVLTVMVRQINNRMISDLLKSVQNLHNIRSLKLEHGLSDSNYFLGTTFDVVALPVHLRHLLASTLCFSRLPSCINPSCLTNLSHAELTVISMDEQSMQILGSLPELRHLALTTESTVTVANIATDGCFQKLRCCRFPDSMVLFVLNEDSTVSFTLWNGIDDIVLGSRKKDECARAPAVMPNLEEISFMVGCDWSMTITKCQYIYDHVGLEYLTSLQKVSVTIDCHTETMEAEAVDQIHAANVHPNHPKLILTHQQMF